MTNIGLVYNIPFMSNLEWVAAFFGLWCGWLMVVQNVWGWPIGIVQVVLYIFVFYEARLYSDMTLQVIFIFVQLYGWYYWMYGKKDEGEKKVPVVSLSRSGKICWSLITLLGAISLGTFMANKTKADLAYLDATGAVMSLVAQYLQGIKILESWLIWIVVDVLSIGIYIYKGLFPTTLLYIVYLGMAVKGFIEWRKHRKSEQPA